MASGNGGDDSRVTERMVLERAYVIVVPADVDLEQLLAPDAAQLRKMGVRAEKREAWLTCGVHEGASKRHSIEAFTGKAGTPDARVGVFKAVPAAGWKGGVAMEAPPKPLVHASLFED